jgi:hypothetical protein
MRTEIECPEQFQQIISGSDKVIIIFYQPQCGICRWYMKRLDEQFDYINYYAVDVTKQYDWYRHNAKLRFGFPFTRIYKEGKITYKIDGELYPLQINKLFTAFKKL